MNQIHTPVLLDEVIHALQVEPGRLYVDATLGGGGHTQAILEKTGSVIGIEQDPEAIQYVKESIKSPNLTLIKGNFRHLHRLVIDAGIHQVSGVLFDLGVSSLQFDQADRGFSFQADAPLDMRMDPTATVSARDLVNALGKKELVTLLKKYGDEPRANAISQAIVDTRKNQPIDTTGQLAGIIEMVYGSDYQSKIHPATKTFQALRIAINDELNALMEALPQAINLLEPGGRLVVISFHQGEDKIVKQFIKQHHQTVKNLTKKPMQPTKQEIKRNIRARSAKLRIAQKI